MSKIVLFGGTTEGRKLAGFCERHQIETVVCVVSQYGEMLLPKSSYLTVKQKPLSLEDMEKLFQEEKPELVLDATHPYAKAATENIAAACAACGINYVRVLRETKEWDVKKKTEREYNGAENDRIGGVHGGTVWVNSVKEAVEWLKVHQGTALVTTGSKELEAFTQLDSYTQRIYARVLPDSQALAHCEKLGFAKNHLIAMQGPFSLEMNRAILKMTKAQYLVTKESGQAGGFLEKVEAAGQLGVTSLVIGRPVGETGISLQEAYRLLEGYGTRENRNIYLVGIGMGGPGQWTLQASEAVRQADAVAGADRMLSSVKEYLDGKERFCSYKSGEILDWFLEKPELKSLAVVYSGDTGFYSGAQQMIEEIHLRNQTQNQNQNQNQNLEVQVIPGISTVSYLCAKLQIPWQDVCLASIHGRDADLKELLANHKKVFLLLGGQNPVESLCRQLTEMGFGKALVSVGVRLSYPEEQIFSGEAKELAEKWAGQPDKSLCAALIQCP